MAVRARLVRIGLAAVLAAAAAGCTYDYLQRTDHVGYSYGDAVRANLEAGTDNPSRASAYSTRGLGQNGVVTTTTTVAQESAD